MDTLNEWMSFLGYTKQIDTYEKSLLNEADPSYSQKIYGLPIKVAMSKAEGGEVKQTIDEIKGIQEVTIVKTVPGTTSTDKANHYSTLYIKFELTGGRDALAFKKTKLIPSLIAIPGLHIRYVGDLELVERD
jgi:hypothetical protein